MKTKLLIGFLTVLVFSLVSIPAIANKTSVEVTAPDKAEKGSEVTLTIKVKHMGNTAAHFTDWISVKVNGKEVKRWKYDKKERPEAGNFTLEYKFVLNEKSKIEVQGHCNKHGSSGTKKLEINLK